MFGRIFKNFRIVLILLILFPGMLVCQKSLTVETIYRELKIKDRLPDALRWLPNSPRFSFLDESDSGMRGFYVVHGQTGERSRQFSVSHLDSLTTKKIKFSLKEYQWLPDETGVIFPGSGDLWLYSIVDDTLFQLTDTPIEEEEFQLSPNGKQVGFVRNNDLFVLEINTQKEYRLTRNGDDTTLNGKLDWVYQEELVGRGIFKGFWWSPDSRKIAYLHFDESSVPEYPLVDWIPYHPDFELMRFPKAGDPNPIVTLGVVSIQQHPEIVWMDTGTELDQYIPRVYWVPGSKKLAFERLDRKQQHLELLIGEVSNGESRVILEERDPYFINIEDQVHFFQSGDRFLWGSDRSGYRHMYLFGIDGTLIQQITKGQWTVTELNGVDERNEVVYFTSTRKDVRGRQLFRVGLDGADLVRITDRAGTHDVTLSAGFRYYTDEFDDVLIHPTLELFRTSGESVAIIDANPQPTLKEFNLQKPEFLTINDDEDRMFYASMIKPRDFNPKKKYPVLIYVYGGPHGQVVRRTMGSSRELWHQMMAQKGYIIFRMDNRGSYGRGHHWEEVVYGRLGEIELRDQLVGVEYLKSLPYVNSNRIGIWGWSYGGYMTLYALTHSDAFSTGVSVAPVTDWRDYDTIYTERYMGLPSENPEGYEQSAPRYAAADLRGQLLLVHGTGDDNVHLQNTIHMINALIDGGIDFDLMLYPQKKHGISSDEDRVHLFKKMTKYIEENL